MTVETRPYAWTKRERAAYVREFIDKNGNMDSCSDRDALMRFWASVNFSPVVCARAIFRARPDGYVRATRDLANYASNRATALQCRENGQDAFAYEYAMDLIYDRLPCYASEIARAP